MDGVASGLKVYCDLTDWIIAESPEEAVSLQANKLCISVGDASKPGDFDEVPMDRKITIGSDDPQDLGGRTRLTLTASEWIDRNGRGWLCSTEW